MSVDAPDGANAVVTVSASVTNTGSAAGAEVVQVYLGVPVAGQPPKRLVGFQKVFVEPGESKLVAVTIEPAATNHPFSVWDYCTHGFATKPGRYAVYVGNSADDTPHTTTLTLTEPGDSWIAQVRSLPWASAPSGAAGSAGGDQRGAPAQ